MRNLTLAKRGKNVLWILVLLSQSAFSNGNNDRLFFDEATLKEQLGSLGSVTATRRSLTEGATARLEIQLPHACASQLELSEISRGETVGFLVSVANARTFSSCLNTCRSTPTSEGCSHRTTRFETLVSDERSGSRDPAFLAQNRDGSYRVLGPIAQVASTRESTRDNARDTERQAKAARDEARNRRNARVYHLERVVRTCRRDEEELNAARSAYEALCQITGERRHCDEGRLFQELERVAFDARKREALKIRDAQELHAEISDLLAIAAEKPELERLYAPFILDLMKKFVDLTVREERRYARSSGQIQYDTLIADLTALRDDLELTFESEVYFQQAGALVTALERQMAAQEARERQKELQELIARGFDGRGYTSEFTSFFNSEFRLAQQRAQLACSIQTAAAQCQQARQDIAILQSLPQQAQLAFQQERVESLFGSTESRFFGPNGAAAPQIQNPGIGAASIFGNSGGTFGTIPSLNISNNAANSPNQPIFPTLGNTGMNGAPVAQNNPYAVQPQYQPRL